MPPTPTSTPRAPRPIQRRPPLRDARPSPLPHNLCPAVPGSDPLSTIAWIFTPIFQAIFMTLAFFYNLTHDIGTAIILVTLVMTASC